MKRKMVLVVALALLVAACGPDGNTEPTRAAIPADVPGVKEIAVVEDPAELRPGPRDASPEPVAEPVFKPVPEPAPASSPKPVRSNLPTPPPTRRRPAVVAPDPAVPRVPPALDLRPGGIVPADDVRVTAAVADLAIRLGQDTDAIDVLDAREVTWRDGSVGCPTPEMGYPQVLVPGFLVVLRSGDSSYRYHSAGDLLPFLCETPQAPLEGSA
ncbi:MAG: hypothetical protein KJO97_03075 [Acidimicrobiia bacterium]|nr:hypothetical protein [Acidimicrobiia bacterium]